MMSEFYGTLRGEGHMLRALTFDMDGTLGDTHSLCVEAYRRCTRELTGRLPSAQEVEEKFGVSDRGVLGQLLGMDPEDERLPIAKLVEVYERLHTRMAPGPVEGIRETLEELRGMGLLLAVITGKEHYTALPTLRRYGMENSFQRVLYGTPSHNNKAEQLTSLLNTWKLSASELIYVGDMPSDIRMAHEAGVRIINAAWAAEATRWREECLALKPDFRLTHVSELCPLVKKLMAP